MYLLSLKAVGQVFVSLCTNSSRRLVFVCRLINVLVFQNKGLIMCSRYADRLNLLLFSLFWKHSTLKLRNT